MSVDVYQWAIENKVNLQAVHILGNKNVSVDALSRRKVIPTE